MVVVGVDAHKATYTMVGVDAGGRRLDELTVKATGAGHLRALDWARSVFGADVLWGVEDCRNLSSRLERALLDAGQRVVRVPPHLMARTRASARTRGKSDPIDALAVARAVLREPDLPVATHDGVSRELKLLVDRREDLVIHRTATINRLLWRVHELDPSRAPKHAALNRVNPRHALDAWLASQTGLVASLARDELADITSVTEEIDALEKQIAVRVRTAAPSLLRIVGCAELTAAKVVAETAGVQRFRREAAFACYAGVAPLPHWSGSTRTRVRVGRSGNRQLNAALYRIALTQRRHPGPGQEYFRKRREAHDSPAEATRRLQRRVARRVFGCLRADFANRHATDEPLRPIPELERINADWSRALLSGAL
ncbi:IS110 family transposase [Mycobacterium heidelbergense]|uniref:IS110 family transposase n=1 Tax=Mycobacterium heidelbergense TaxID=53376 RepID=UPI003CFA9517